MELLDILLARKFLLGRPIPRQYSNLARSSVYPNDSGEVLRNLRRAANNASLIELAIAVAQPEPTCPSILAIVNAQGLLKALLQSHWVHCP